MLKEKFGMALVAAGAALVIGAACDDAAPLAEEGDAGPASSADAGDANSNAPSPALLSDAELSTFTGTYRVDCGDASEDAGAPYSFVGFEPTAPGTYPVFLYTVGTYFGKDGAAYDEPEALLHIREMARRGFVAVSVAYKNGSIPVSCEEVDKKAACIYGDVPGSAMPAICSRPSAGCTTKGVVVAGESQGAVIALRSQNHFVADAIKGAWVRSVVDAVEVGYRDCTNTTATGTRRLANARIWATNGADDGTPGTDLETLQRVTGWPADGITHRDSDADHGGYFQVQASDLQPGHTNGADHTYHRYPDGARKALDWDDNWEPPATTPWSLNARLDWLSGLVTH